METLRESGRFEGLYKELFLTQSATAAGGTSHDVERLPHRFSQQGAMAFAIDPKTAELIIQAGSLLLSLFQQSDYSATKRQLSEISTWINQIADDIHHVNQMLQDIKEELASLRVYIDRAFVRDAELTVLARIETFVKNVPALKANPQSLELRQMFLAMYSELQSSAAKLRLYGYANVYTSALAMRTELDLIELLDLGKDVYRNSAAAYSDYFRAAINGGIVGSLPNARLSFRNDANNVAVVHVAGLKGFQLGGWRYRDNPHEVCHSSRLGSENCKTEYDYWRLDPGLEITGAIDTGFGARAVDVGHVYKDSSPAPQVFNSRAEALAAANAAAQGCATLAEYRAASDQFRNLNDSGDRLIECEKRAKDFADVASRLRDK